MPVGSEMLTEVLAASGRGRHMWRRGDVSASEGAVVMCSGGVNIARTATSLRSFSNITSSQRKIMRNLTAKKPSK